MALDQFTMDRRVFRDESTGREVWQVTDGEFECVAPYMECPVWTPDDRYLIFTSNRTGTWQPYRLEVATGRATQLLEAESANYRSINLDPVHGEVYCESGLTHAAVNIETLAARVAVDFSRFYPVKPAGGKGWTPVLSGDGGLWALGYQTPEGDGALIVAPTDGSNEFEMVRLSHPEIIPGHVQFCPGDDNLLSFCAAKDRQNDPHETPFLRAREYRGERDTGEVRPLVLMPPGFRATHCVWGRSGERMYFHRKTVPTWVPTALCSVNREGEALRVYYETSDALLGHSSPSPDERWLVTDSQDPDENLLMLVSTERDEQHLLCWPNTSIGSGRPDKRSPALPPHTDRHTHPGFSLSGRYVHYTSDVSGRSQVYVVPVADLVCS